MGTGAGTAEEDDAIPRAYFLATPGLNPMPGGGVVSFGLPVDARVQLAVYNVEGRKVSTLADGHLEAGRYSVTWAGEDGEGRKVSPGVYFIHLRANQWSGRPRSHLGGNPMPRNHQPQGAALGREGLIGLLLVLASSFLPVVSSDAASAGFIENRGQQNAVVRFYRPGALADYYFTAQGLVVDLKQWHRAPRGATDGIMEHLPRCLVALHRATRSLDARSTFASRAQTRTP